VVGRLFEELLPRHLMLIYQINNYMLGEVTRKYPGNMNKMSKMSVIEEGREKSIRMAQLSIVGSHTVNGVAELHYQHPQGNHLPGFRGNVSREVSKQDKRHHPAFVAEVNAIPTWQA
jgi:glucan phosphorylase